MDIGKTRSGTIVEYIPNQTIEEFSQEFLGLSDSDKFDVFCIYQFLFVRAKPTKDIKPDDYDWWVSRVRAIERSITDECVEVGKLETNAHTSYQMVQLGKNMVNDFWR